MAKLSKRTIGALWLLIAPTALIIGSFMLFAILNWAFSFAEVSLSSDDLFAESPLEPIRVAFNVLLFVLGVIGSISWLPGLIVGIVLLATKPAAPVEKK